MIIWITISLILGLIYLGISIWLSRGLYNVDVSSEIEVTRDTITVLVAARNEEKTLPKLFDSLLNQTLDRSLWEVIVINDRSTDNTLSVIEEYKERIPSLSVLNVEKVPMGIAPKKNAIMMGVESSRTDIIAVTDADCIVPENWLSLIQTKFSDNGVVLVQGLTGYSETNRQTLLDRFQTVDFFSHSVVAAAGIGRNLPINSNANNFAYRKTIFDKLDGYGNVASVVSGDDDLLLQRVWEQKIGRIVYMATRNGAVETEAPSSLKEMFEQRKRWGSKTVYYKPRQTAVLASIFLFYISLFVNSFAALINCTIGTLWATLFILKIIGELFFMAPGVRLFQKKNILKDVWWASFFHLYLIIFSVFNGVFGSFHWKGSQFSRKTKS